MSDPTTSSCPHFAIVLEESGVNQQLLAKYKSVVNWNINRYHSVKGSVKRRKVSIQHWYQSTRTDLFQVTAPSCRKCGLTLARTFACLHCPYTGCWLDGHISRHLQENDHDFCKSYFTKRMIIFDQHFVGVDATTGIIFCNQCNDFIFDHTLSKIFWETKILAEEKYGSLKSDVPPPIVEQELTSLLLICLS